MLPRGLLPNRLDRLNLREPQRATFVHKRTMNRRALTQEMKSEEQVSSNHFLELLQIQESPVSPHNKPYASLDRSHRCCSNHRDTNQ